MIPRIRRVLAPGLSYGRKIRWGGLELPPPDSRSGALPHELRTWGRETGDGGRETKYRRWESNPHRPCGPRRSERRAYAFRHGGMMAPAGVEPATRWISPSRSTGELQEPESTMTGFPSFPSFPSSPSCLPRSRRDSNPHSPERQSGALAVALRLLVVARCASAMARQTNDRPTRESRDLV